MKKTNLEEEIENMINKYMEHVSEIVPTEFECNVNESTVERQLDRTSNEEDERVTYMRNALNEIVKHITKKKQLMQSNGIVDSIRYILSTWHVDKERIGKAELLDGLIKAYTA